VNDLQANYFFDLRSYAHAGLFEETVHVWEALTQVSKYLQTLPLGRIEVKIPSGAFLVDPHLISIGQGSVVEPGAYIKGPCIIGKGCTIRHGAYIRGQVIMGDRCVFGHDSEAKNTILLNDVHAAHFAYLGDTILGNKVNLGAGTKCANLKLIPDPIVIQYRGEKINSGLRKLGAVIGDFSQIGCNAVTNPGTLVGQHVVWYPCVNFGGFIPSNSIVKADVRVLVTTGAENSRR
jgi:NDP-sugar pyrophosphorylase family protein